MARNNVPRMVGMAALLLLLLLSGTATSTSYPSADQYSLRNHYRITRRSAGHEILPNVSTDDYEDDEERQRQAVSLTELLKLWEPQHREEEKPLRRGDIEVTTKGIERGDVPVIGKKKKKKFVKRQAPVEMWGFAEDDGMLPSDEDVTPRPVTPHLHRKHHRNSGLIEPNGGNSPMRWRGPEEEMRQRPELKDRRRYNNQPNERQGYDEDPRRRLYEMRRMPDEVQRRDDPRQHAQPDADDENGMRRRQEEEQRQRPPYDLRRRQEEQQRRENSRQNENDRRMTPNNGEDESRRRQEDMDERRRAYEARRREEYDRQNNDRRKQPENHENESRRRQEEEERRRAYEMRRREESERQNEGRRKQPDSREEDESRQRPEEEERQRTYDARRREEDQRQRGRNSPADAADTYEKRMQEWLKMKEEHDRLVREREELRKQQEKQRNQPDFQRPQAQTKSEPREDQQQRQPPSRRPEAQTKSPEELENERKLQDYIRRNTPITVTPSGNRNPASDIRMRENEQVRRAEYERRLEEERRRKQVEEESRRLAEEERMRRTHEGEDADGNKTRHRGTSPVRPRWPINTASSSSRTPVESNSNSRRPIPQYRPEDSDARYLESRRNDEEASSSEASDSNSRGPSSETSEEEGEEERLKRLKGLPVSATIIVRPSDTGANHTSTPPALHLRFGEDIDFPGFNPNRSGPVAFRFPAPVTRRPPVASPQPCVWAIVVCCQQHRQNDSRQAMKITRCFEATNCPGASWDTERRCGEANVRAANEEIRDFYVKGQERTSSSSKVLELGD